MVRLAVILLCLLSVTGYGQTGYHVTTTGGGATSAGSVADPWRLTYALDSSSAGGGDTIWVHGGDYYGPAVRKIGQGGSSMYASFWIGIEGDSASAPVIIRNWNNERARLIGPLDSLYEAVTVGIKYDKDFIWLWGLEITCVGNNRQSDSLFGDHPYNWNFVGGITMDNGFGVTQEGIKLINLVIYEVAEGMDAWSTDQNFEAYGCVLYNIGAMIKDGDGNPIANGYGLYWQNAGGSGRWLRQCIISNVLGANYAIHAYGQSGPTTGFTLDSNVVVRSANLVGGGDGVTTLDFIGNHIYKNGTSLGYTDPLIGSTVTGNKLYRSTESPAIEIREPSGNTFTGNTFLSAPVCVDTVGAWYGNCLGTDSNTVLVAWPTTGSDVYVYENAYDSTRTNIVVYNWTNASTVKVKVSPTYSDGQVVTLRNAMNMWGDSAQSLIVVDDSITVPMDSTTWTMKQYQATEQTPAQTFPTFGVFVGTLNSDPTITTSGTLSEFSALKGDTSAEQSYSVSGANIADSIVVTAPTGFRISTTSGSGYAQFLGLTPVDGTVASTTIYVTFWPTQWGSVGPSNITHVSTGATQQNVSVSGTCTAVKKFRMHKYVSP